MYEVYVCRVDGEVVYIGCGKVGRHQHCTSGCNADKDLVGGEVKLVDFTEGIYRE